MATSKTKARFIFTPSTFSWKPSKLSSLQWVRHPEVNIISLKNWDRIVYFPGTVPRTFHVWPLISKLVSVSWLSKPMTHWFRNSWMRTNKFGQVHAVWNPGETPNRRTMCLINMKPIWGIYFNSHEVDGCSRAFDSGKVIYKFDALC